MTNILDPVLSSFWEGFPCPPPWRSGLLLELNFSGCLGVTIGDRIRSLMLSRCGVGRNEIMNTNSTSLQDNPEPRFIMEYCAMNCKLLIVSICIVLFTGLLSGAIIILYRNYHPKLSGRNALPRSRSNASTKAFSSCHYASAPVICRSDETSFNQDKAVCTYSRMKTGAPHNRYDKLRFPPEKRSQIYPGMRDEMLLHYENDVDTSNVYESVDKCDSSYSSPLKFGRHYKFSQGETILSVSSDMDTDDNLCQVSVDQFNDEESFSSVACNQAYEHEESDDGVSRDYFADLNFDISCSNLTPVVTECQPTFSTFNKEIAYS